MRRMLVLGALALGGCGGSGEDPPAPEPPPREGFELRPVAATAIAELEGVLHDPPPSLPPTDREEVLGLVTFVAGSTGAMRDAGVDDLRALGDAALPHLRAIADDEDLDGPVRVAAVRGLAALDTELAGAELASIVRDSRLVWQRANAAYFLRETSRDEVVPELILRLKYEKDHGTVVWIAATLARFGNYAGLDGLFAVANGPDGEASAAAEAELARLADEAGLSDAAELDAAWREGGELPRHEHSPHLKLALWKWIARLAEFQLRGVDDTRFLFERMGAQAAELLAQALHDENVYVRVHAAQCLQRMGPRGRGAGPELLAGLNEPELGPHAAVALGRVQYAEAAEALAERLRPPTPLNLRLACARALGFLGEPSAVEPLTELFEDELVDLRQAAAESLLSVRGERADVERALEFLLDPRVDPGSTERALRTWLASADDRTPALDAWDALTPLPQTILTPEESRNLRSRRAAVVRESLSP